MDHPMSTPYVTTPSLTHPRPDVLRFSPDAASDAELRRVLGLAAGGGAELGEVLAATAGIRPGDHDEWVGAWTALAERTAAAADTASAGGHRVSAAEAYLRSSVYRDVTVRALAAAGDTRAAVVAFRLQRAAWESYVALSPVPAERVDIPFALTSLPGYIFRPRSSASTGATVVAVNGGEGSLAALWAAFAHAAVQRGHNVLVFDGPGQQSQRFERNVPPRADWEHVLSPVYDFAVRLPGVDPGRVALYGASLGGYWVTRALAFEHRFAAAVTDPGVVDVTATWSAAAPAPLLSAAELAHRITTPLLIADPDGEAYWPGQSAQLAALTPGVSTLLSFADDDGAGGHAEPLARTIANQRMLDWLDDRVTAA
jgi:dienelactone hydrolase